MENQGKLVFEGLTNSQRQLFIDYMHEYRKDATYDLLSLVLDDKFIFFLSVFAGMSFRVPQAKDLIRIMNYIRIYDYCEKRGFTDEAIQSASEIFKRIPVSIRRIIAKVDKELKGDKGQCLNTK